MIPPELDMQPMEIVSSSSTRARLRACAQHRLVIFAAGVVVAVVVSSVLGTQLGRAGGNGDDGQDKQPIRYSMLLNLLEDERLPHFLLPLCLQMAAFNVWRCSLGRYDLTSSHSSSTEIFLPDVPVTAGGSGSMSGPPISTVAQQFAACYQINTLCSTPDWSLLHFTVTNYSSHSQNDMTSFLMPSNPLNRSFETVLSEVMTGHTFWAKLSAVGQVKKVDETDLDAVMKYALQQYVNDMIDPVIIVRAPLSPSAPNVSPVSCFASTDNPSAPNSRFPLSALELAVPCGAQIHHSVARSSIPISAVQPRSGSAGRR
jgi:hypothetical protein